MITIKQLKEELAQYPEGYYCYPTLNGYIYMENKSSELDKPKSDKYTVDPYSARALILKLEQEYDLDIRVLETTGYVHICIDRAEKPNID